MANWSNLKAAISNVIKANGNQEITGQVLQNTLNNIVSTVGKNATFAGIAVPTTNPGTPDGPVFYIATQAGTYSNFGGVELANPGMIIFYNNSAGNWLNRKVYECLQELGDSTDFPVSQKAVSFSQAMSNTFLAATFEGGTLLTGEEYGVFYIGQSFDEAPKTVIETPIVRYTATELRETICVLLRDQYIVPYRWLAIFDKSKRIVTEIACNMPAGCYATILQKGYTIVASCAVYLNPTVITLTEVNNTLTEVNNTLTEVNNTLTEVNNTLTGIINNAKFAFCTRGFLTINRENGTYSTDYAVIYANGVSYQSGIVNVVDEPIEEFNRYGQWGAFFDALTKKVRVFSYRVFATADFTNLYLIAYGSDIYKEDFCTFTTSPIRPNLTLDKIEQNASNTAQLKPKVDRYIEIENDGYLLWDIDRSYATEGWSRHSDKILVKRVKSLYSCSVISSETFAIAFLNEQGEVLRDISIVGNNKMLGKVVFTEEQRKAHSFIIQFYAASEEQYLKRKTAYVIEFDDGISNYLRIDELEKKCEELQIKDYTVFYKNCCKLGIADYQLPTADINHIAIYGQSLSTGTQGCPVISKENFRGNLMVGQYEWLGGTGSNNKSGLNLLKAIPVKGEGYIPTGISDQTNGETSALTFTNAAKELFDNHVMQIIDRKFLDTSSGAGGNTIETLSKDYPPSSGRLYKNFTDALSTVKSLADSQGKSVVCTALVWMQGEWNETQHENQGWTGTEPATANTDDYQKMLQGGQTSDGVQHNGLINDMIEDVKNTYGQENAPIILGSTIGRGYHRFFENPIDMALLRTSNTSNGKFIIATPSYRVTDRGGHLDANGYRWCGEFFAKVWYKRVILKENWHPLQPIKIKRYSKNGLLISFNIPEPPLKFDINQVKEGTNYGFTVKNNDIISVIQSIEIINDIMVNITFSSDISGKLEIGYATAGNTYGNLRDSDEWIAQGVYTDLDSLIDNPEGVSYRPAFEPKDSNGNVIYGKKYPMQNFCVPFYYKLEAEEQEINISID